MDMRTVFQRQDGSYHSDPVEAAMHAELLMSIDPRSAVKLRDAAIKRAMEISEESLTGVVSGALGGLRWIPFDSEEFSAWWDSEQNTEDLSRQFFESCEKAGGVWAK